MLALDYCFKARHGELQKATALVFAPRPSGAVGATQVAKKGVEDVAVEFVHFYLEARGAREVVLRADQGPAAQALLGELRR
eukprot:1520796-Pyramimonas_sp.AAC.1